MLGVPTGWINQLRVKWRPRSLRGESAMSSGDMIHASAPDSQIFRLVISIGAVLVVVIVAATWALLANLRAEQIDRAERDLDSMTLLIAEQIDRNIQSIDLVQSNILERIRSLGAGSTAELEAVTSGFDFHQRLRDQMAALQPIDALVLTTPDGKLINFSRSWPVPHLTKPDPARERMLRSTHTAFVDRPTRSPASGHRILPIVRKVTSPNGAVIGALIGAMRLSYFEQLFRSIARDHDRSIALFSVGDTLIARYPRDDALRGRSFADRAIFKDVLSKEPYGTVQQASMITGKRLLFSGRRLQHYPLAVVVTRRVDDVLAGWWSAATYIASAALIITLMVIVSVVLVARQFAVRLKAQNRRLDAALNNMSQGLTMLDSAGRLIVCNERYMQMFNLSRDDVRAGTSLAELLHRRIANGTFTPDTVGDPDTHAAAIIKGIAEGQPISLLCELSDGRIISVTNRPMPGGGWVATHDDITESRRQAASFQLLFDRNPLPMWVYDLESSRFLAVNDAAISHYGYSREQFMAMTMFDLRPPEERAKFREFLSTFNGTEEKEQIWRHWRADGTPIDIAGHARALSYRGRRACIVAIHDITDRKRAEEELRRTKKFLDTIVENVPVPILVKEAPSAGQDVSACRYTLVNRAAEELFGVPREHIIGKSAAELYPQERVDFITVQNNEVLRSGQPVTVSDHTVHTPGNGVRVASAQSVAVRDDDDKPQYLLTVLQDNTDRKRAEHRIARMAHYDSLTDLPNRITFNDAMAAAIERAGKTGEAVAVLLLDLDSFKDANDTYGHAVGDALLQEVSLRLQAAAEGAFVARVGGDEFALIVTGGKPSATLVAEQLLNHICDEVSIEDRRISITATIGGAVYPQDGADPATLMISADISLHCAKAAARGSMLFFESEMGDAKRERRALQADLRAALDRGELFLHYQPQKTIAGEIIGFEALLRWQSPERGPVSPATFIPIAEESGLIVPIGNWALREACREAASWSAPLTVAVNISPLQFRVGDFPATVQAALLESELPPSRLELEITEGVLIDDFSRAISLLSRLKMHGVRIALDDFGTGYSSLSYLHAFSFDKIKIDRTFIGDLERNRHSMAIVRAVIDLGHSLNVPILAEGVETAEQHAILLRNGCDEVQGYYLGRPLPIDAYAELIGLAPNTARACRAG